MLFFLLPCQSQLLDLVSFLTTVMFPYFGNLFLFILHLKGFLKLFRKFGLIT